MKKKNPAIVQQRVPSKDWQIPDNLGQLKWYAQGTHISSPIKLY